MTLDLHLCLSALPAQGRSVEYSRLSGPPKRSISPPVDLEHVHGTKSPTFSLCETGLKILKYGCGSVPVLALHCHPPLFDARSPSISFSMKY